MIIRPLHNNVLIKQEEIQDSKYGRIVVADTGKEKPLQGEIVAIGPGRTTETGAWVPTSLKEGQKVLFPSFDGTRTVIDGVEYLIYKESSILAVLEND